jgi:hypothetical protein
MGNGTFRTSLKNAATRNIILILLTLCSIALMFSFPPIGQDPSYHNFADQRKIFNVPNFWNVVTNLPFVIIGLVGLLFFLFDKRSDNPHSLAYIILFFGVIGIGFGSARYHYHPTNSSLVWDRIPMSITFMSYFSIIVARYVNGKLGSLILFPLLVLGAASIFYWYMTEQHGNGDLRLYGWVQFYPMLCIPLILFLYPASRSVRLKIISVIFVYAGAKVAERADDAVFNFLEVISGHSLKHLMASISVLLILLTLKENHKTRRDLTVDLA